MAFSWLPNQNPGPGTWSADGLPAGLVITPETGSITGTPANSGRYPVVIHHIAADSATTHFPLDMRIGSAIPTEGLVSAWLGEGNPDDVMANHPGVAQNGVAFIPGAMGRAFSFDGVDDSVDLGSWFDLKTFTIACWVQANSSQNTYADIMDNNHTGSRSWVWQYQNQADSVTTRWQFGFNNVGGRYIHLAHQTWHHIVVSLDGLGGAVYYQDGREVDRITGTGQLYYDGTQFLRLGRWGGGGRHFRGAIDDLLIYDRVLTATEIQALTNSPSAATATIGDLMASTDSSQTWQGEATHALVPGPDQTASATASPQAAVVFDVRVRNTSDSTRSFLLRSDRSTFSDWTVLCQAEGGDISQQILASPGYRTAEIPPGGTTVITMSFLPNRLVPAGTTKSLPLLLADASNSNAPLDSMLLFVEVGAVSQPDLLIRRATEATEIGNNVYENTALSQRLRQRVSPENSAEYRIRLTNDGNTEESFLLRAPAAEQLGWDTSITYEQSFASFDGYDDVINVGSWGPGEQWCVEAWVRPTSLPTSGRHTIAGGFNEYRDWGITFAEGKFHVAYSRGSFAAPAPAVANEWVHVAGTFDGSVAKLFINGVQVASGSADPYTATAAGTRIGGELCCWNNTFSGQIRDVRIWNRARTEQEIASSLAIRLAGNESGLLGYWPLDEESGTAAFDAGPFDHHGTFLNGAQWIKLQRDITQMAATTGFATSAISPADSQGRLIIVRTSPLATLDDGAVLDLQLSVSSLIDSSKSDAVLAVSQKSTSTVLPGESAPVAAFFSSDADYESGFMVGVENESIPNQIQLSEHPNALPFLWVPNSNQGTISKIDTRDGRELARYRVCPQDIYGNPSRTTIDQLGNCWVANRRTGSAVKVGLLENGQWLDRNQNGVADTSQDVNGDGVISDSELFPWGADECVLSETILIPGKEGAFTPGTYTAGYANDDWNPGPRSVAVDASGNLWVGSWGIKAFHYLDGQSGAILKNIDVASVNHTPYGAVIDPQGILWSSSHDKAHVLRLDPVTNAFSTVSMGSTIYGLGLDADQHLFVSGWQTSKLHRINTETGLLEWTRSASYESRGVAVTSDGDVWTADSGPATVTRFNHDGAVKARIAVGATPTGVAVDAAGCVWVVHNGDDTVRRIDPSTNHVDLIKSIPGTNHYGYSDMTGIVARNTTTRFGFWSAIHDSRKPHCVWGIPSWVASIPSGSSIVVRVRSSEDGLVWSAWETASQGTSLATTPPGRFLEVKAELRAPVGSATPTLQEIQVSAASPMPTDLAVTVACDTANPCAEHAMTARITVSNQGAAWASGASLTVPVPEQFEVISVDSPNGARQVADGVLHASYPGIAPGETRTITLTGIPWAPGSMPLSATVTADLDDLAPADNSMTLPISVAALVSMPPPNGLLAWWPGNSSFADRVENRVFGEWNGASFGTGKVDQAFQFDGNDDYLELANPHRLHADHAMTASGWFKTEGFRQTWQCIYFKGNPVETPGCDNREISLFLNSNGSLHFSSTPINQIGIARCFLDSPVGSVTPGLWYHFATVVDCRRGVMEIFLNGELVASGVYPRTSIRSTEGPLRLAANTPGQYHYPFFGAIDEFALFGRALESSEIASLYDVRSAGMNSSQPIISAPSQLPTAMVGQFYSTALTAVLGTPPYTWSISAGDLPPGLSLSTSGTISGTPSVAGTFPLTVKITDHPLQSSERVFAINVGTALTPQPTLAALWPAESSADDRIGSSHGTLGPMTFFVPGVKGAAFHFIDHQNSFVNFPNTAALQVPADRPRFTIEAWVRPDYNVTGDKVDTILSKRDGCSGNFSYIFGVLKGHRGYLGNLYLSMSGLPGNWVLSTALVPDDDQFHHVAVSYDHEAPQNNIIFYIDGVAAGSTSTSVVPPSTSEGPCSGRHSSCGYYSTMSVDELAFHQAALSPEEIQSRVSAAAAGYFDAPDADLMLRPVGTDDFLTEGVRETTPIQQIAAVSTAPLAPVAFELLVRNDSSQAKSFILRALESNSDGWTRNYVTTADADVTSAIKAASGYQTSVLAPGGSETLFIRLTPSLSATGGASIRTQCSTSKEPMGRASWIP